jgi:hypothetical protein
MDPIDTGNPPKTGGLKPYSLGNTQKRPDLDLEAMDVSELLALRDKIDAKLPSTSLKDINVEQEVLLQYYRVKDLQEKAADAPDVPTNQRAQVANSVANTLKEIVKMREKVYNAEQFRKMEAALAKVLRTQPKEVQDAFFAAYEKSATEMAA